METESGKSYVAPWLVFLLRPIHTLFFFFYFDFHMHHQERIPAQGPAILAPVHRSRWDAFMFYCLTKRYPRFMASKDEFVGLQGWFMRRMGAFPVNTQKPSTSTMRHCQELIAQGEMLVIFPEGNLHYYAPHEVHPLKPGTAWLALNFQKECPECSLPVVPIRFVYAQKVLGFRSRIDVFVQEPISVQDYLALPSKEGIRQLTADLQKALGDVVNPVPAPQVLPATR